MATNLAIEYIGGRPSSRGVGSSSVAAGHVTPVVLTFNEAANIGRVLRSLAWAPDVFIVDSGSMDGTREITEGFRNVRWRVRPFDNHRAQWEFAVESTP